ncbi:MAG: hypothetical protein ACRENI_12930 [Gemmatimonadaceae bacterium]
MLRTVFTIGLFAVLGLFVLKLLFGVLGGLLGVVWWLFWIAIKIALIGVAVYFLIRVFSPETARRLRSKFSNSNY